MDNCNEIYQRIGKNLSFYRKAAGLTQAELAEKISYSDKSVSKWESGNGAPDVYTMMQIADLYGVTLDSIVGEDSIRLYKRKAGGLHVLVMLLSCGLVWLVATCAYVVLRLLKLDFNLSLIFLYAGVLNAVIMIIYASVWRYRILNFISISVLIWVGILAMYVTFKTIAIAFSWDYSGLWSLFILGAPLQALEILWVFFRSVFRKNKRKKAVINAEREKLVK